MILFNSQNYSRVLPEKYKYIFFILNALFHHKLANCRSNLFRESFRSPQLLRTRHSSSGINIFCTGTITWFLTINHHLIQIAYKIHTPSSKITFLPLPRLSREEGPSPRRRVQPHLLKENMSKEFTKKAQHVFHSAIQSLTMRFCIRTFDFCPGSYY